MTRTETHFVLSLVFLNVTRNEREESVVKQHN